MFDNKCIDYLNNYYKFNEDIDFNITFDSLINFCLNFNKKNFGKNYSKSNFFIHIKGGSSIKYKLNNYYGNLNQKITDDIDITLVPFENNPNVRIRLIEELFIALKKEFPKFIWKYKMFERTTKIYLYGKIIFDIVFYDNIKPWYNDFDDNSDQYVLSNISIDDYFSNLKKLFESKLYSQEILEKVTFTSYEFEYQSLKLLIKFYEKKYIEDINKLKINATQKEIYEYKKKYKNKIGIYKKKLFYLTYIMINNDF